MKRRRASGRNRVFVVEVEPGPVVEVELRRVMTWPSLAGLRERLTSGLPMTSKEVRFGERDEPTDVAMRLRLGANDSWTVGLGQNRPVGPFAAGMQLLFLESTFVGSGAAMLWHLAPRPEWWAVVEATKLGLALVESEQRGCIVDAVE